MSPLESRGTGDTDGDGNAPTHPRLGIALSGGGHRATAWGLGVLAAVVQGGLAADTVSIASVSGGSIANAAVAVRGDFTQLVDVRDFAHRVAPTLHVVARTGLFLPGTPTRRYVTVTLFALALWAGALIALVTALGAVARGQPLWPYAGLGAVLGALGALGIGRFLPRRRIVAVIVGAALGGAVAAGTAAAVRDLGLTGGSVAIAVLVLVTILTALVALHALSRRGAAVSRALAEQLSPDGRDPLLREIHSRVNHVFCTTDLEYGNCLFFAPKFIYGHHRGMADTHASVITVAQVTQASAAVPPGFAPVTLPVPPFEPPAADIAWPASKETVPVSDGGVFDNLGDEWEGSFEGRSRRYPRLSQLQEPAEVLLVSDASPPFGRQPYHARGILAPDLLGFMRNIDVMWAATTTRRVHDLKEQFRPGSRHEDHREGVLVMIQQSPMEVCHAAKTFGGGVARRAEEAELFLKAQRSRCEWAELADKCARIPTTLGPLSTKVTLELLELACTTTTVALYVNLGLGSLASFPREVFEQVLEILG